MKPIRTQKDHGDAVAEISALMAVDPEPGTEESDRLQVLATLVEVYEKSTFPLDRPDPVQAIRFRMEEQGLRQADLVPIIGSRSKVSEIFNGKRTLSLPMIRALAKGLGIPAEILISEPPPALKSGAKLFNGTAKSL